MRDGSKRTIHSRWRRDKGHRGEWAAFAESVQQGGAAPISFEELVCSALTTLRIQESVATGKPIAVDTAAFIEAALQTPGMDDSEE